MLRDLVAPADVWAVVKADGYGHGASAVGGAALAAGATRLCVATWEEARALRDALPEAPVLVMSPLAPRVEEADLAGVEVAVSSVESFARLRAAAREPLGVHVKVDTGMGRWGMAEDEARRVVDEIAGSSLLRLSGLMSHLSSADDDADHTRRQLERFRLFADAFCRTARGTSPTARARSATPRRGSTPCAAGSRSTGCRRSATTRPRAALRRRCASRATWPS